MKKKIDLKLYQCRVHLIATDDLRKEYARLHKRYREEPDEDGGIAEAWCVHFDMIDYYVLVDVKHLTVNTIAHEIYHTVSSLLGSRDIKDEESGAWLCGMLMEEALKFYNKFKDNGIHRPVRKVKGNAGGPGADSTDNSCLHQPDDN